MKKVHAISFNFNSENEPDASALLMVRLTCYAVATSLLIACGSSADHQTRDGDHSALVTKTSIDHSLLLASNVEFQSQNGEGVRHRIIAGTVSIAPRSFAAFNLNGLNELLIEDVHIEDFSSNQSNSNGASGDNSDFINALQDYAESMQPIYGIVSRIHMRNIQITLHGAGKNSTNVIVFAAQLTKDFGKDESPELSLLEFHDDQSTNVLKVSSATWNTAERQFIID